MTWPALWSLALSTSLPLDTMGRELVICRERFLTVCHVWVVVSDSMCDRLHELLNAFLGYTA